ncbi:MULTISPECIES: hypothetical protein [unclassified Arthrobacter]|uniref:hypothetical protein n=1 Tax=unclassified Arthrobacter TaxID=235627 RepID=UPI002157530F|nr:MULTISPECIES: hypothetical protein [unclassified Arthrobacter]
MTRGDLTASKVLGVLDRYIADHDALSVLPFNTEPVPERPLMGRGRRATLLMCQIDIYLWPARNDLGPVHRSEVKLGAVAYTFDVDFIHRNPVLNSAVMSEWEGGAKAATLGQVYSSWASFSHNHPRAAHWIALDAFFDDEVPLPLKVRTIAATGRRCIVLGRVSQAQRFALAAEGAVAILDEDSTAAEIPRQIEAVVVGATPTLPPQTSIGTRLTDREIQVLELFAQRRALTASSLASGLGLRTTTVRGHLFRGRRKLTAAGLKCATRGELANALQEIGYSHTDAQWHAAGRW